MKYMKLTARKEVARKRKRKKGSLASRIGRAEVVGIPEGRLLRTSIPAELPRLRWSLATPSFRRITLCPVCRIAWNGFSVVCKIV